VLAELVWVLDSVYRFGRAEIAAAVESVLVGRDRVVEYRDEVQEALTAYKTSGIDFADILIGRVNLARGCEATATFDRKAAKLEGFIRVS
jgi:predicted nucleic-acid-binding protein